jgi:1,4-alpha-glucan branching enzyme
MKTRPSPVSIPKKSSATSGKKKVQFHYQASDSAAVAVAGTFSDWQPLDLTSKADSADYSRTMYLPPGQYEYKFIVDGSWTPDPENEQRIRNELGTENSLLMVG